MTLIALLLLFAVSADAAMWETIAGGRIGDGRLATESPVNAHSVVAAPNGDLYVLDGRAGRIRRVDAQTGVISSVVGASDRSACGYGPAADGVCLGPYGTLALDAAGRLLIANGGMLLRWDPSTTQVEHLAGRRPDDPAGPCRRLIVGETHAPTEMCLYAEDVVAGPDGGVFVLVYESLSRVFRIAGGVASIYAGRPYPYPGPCPLSGPARSACLGHASAMGTAANGDLLVGAAWNRVLWRIDRASGDIEPFPGIVPCQDGEDDPPRPVNCVRPRDVAATPAGDVVLIDSDDTPTLRRIEAGTGDVAILAALPWSARRLAVDAAGGILVTDDVDVLRRHPTTGAVTTVAGNGTRAFCGDGDVATEACIGPIEGIGYDAAGNLLLWDRSSGRVRRVAADTGIITTLARAVPCKDPQGPPGGLCDRVSFVNVSGATVAPNGDVYIAGGRGTEVNYHGIVQRVDGATGAVSVVAGGCTRPELSGIPAADACLGEINGLAWDGGLLISEWQRIRRLDVATGLLERRAGGEWPCHPYADDGDPALGACITAATIATAPDGRLYIADTRGSIWRVDDAGLLRRLAGKGSVACGRRPDDGGAATSGCLPPVTALAIDPLGNVYLTEQGGVLRRVEQSDGTIATIAGGERRIDGSLRCCVGCEFDKRDDACASANAMVFDPQGRLVIASDQGAGARRLVQTCGNGSIETDETCDDGNLVSGDGCDANCTPTACGNGVVTAPETCDDGNVADGDCCGATCTTDPPETACSDGDACSAEACDTVGRCTVERYQHCPTDTAPCQVPRCDGESGACVVAPAEDGTTCAAPAVCSAIGFCVAGSCVSGGPRICDDGNPCTTDTCAEPEGCGHEPIPGCVPLCQIGGCDDADTCTFDRCLEDGTCEREQRSCDDGDPCTDDACDPATGCTYTTSACDDGDPCTEDTCNRFAGCRFATRPQAPACRACAAPTMPMCARTPLPRRVRRTLARLCAAGIGLDAPVTGLPAKRLRRLRARVALAIDRERIDGECAALLTTWFGATPLR